MIDLTEARRCGGQGPLPAPGWLGSGGLDLAPKRPIALPYNQVLPAVGVWGDAGVSYPAPASGQRGCVPGCGEGAGQPLSAWPWPRRARRSKAVPLSWAGGACTPLWRDLMWPVCCPSRQLHSCPCDEGRPPRLCHSPTPPSVPCAFFPRTPHGPQSPH